MLILKIKNPQEYTNNTLGYVVDDILQSGCHHEGVVFFFKMHCAFVTSLKNGEYELTFFRRNNQVYNEHKKPLIDIKILKNIHNTNGFKYIGHHLMNTFREFYPELQGKDFPIEELSFGFFQGLHEIEFFGLDDNEQDATELINL